MIYKCILWGLGQDYNKYINLIKYYVLQNDIEIIGVTSNSMLYKKVDGHTFIKKTELLDKDFDFIIIMSLSNIDEIRKEAIEMGIDEKRIISCDIFDIPNLNLKQYISILQNDLTIFANNCWGGLVYHRMKMKFLSPIINMYFLDEDYLKFLESPQKYIEKDLSLKEMHYNNKANSYYPICYCDDIQLHFLHYDSYNEAKEKWNIRKKRINWNNIFVMMCTENRKSAERFLNLAYERKICFVPFETKEKSLFYMNYKRDNEMSKKHISEIVNGVIGEKYIYYNFLELLSGNASSSRIEIE